MFRSVCKVIDYSLFESNQNYRSIQSRMMFLIESSDDIQRLSTRLKFYLILIVREGHRAPSVVYTSMYIYI